MSLRYYNRGVLHTLRILVLVSLLVLSARLFPIEVRSFGRIARIAANGVAMLIWIEYVALALEQALDWLVFRLVVTPGGLAYRRWRRWRIDRGEVAWKSVALIAHSSRWSVLEIPGDGLLLPSSIRGYDVLGAVIRKNGKRCWEVAITPVEMRALVKGWEEGRVEGVAGVLRMIVDVAPEVAMVMAKTLIAAGVSSGQLLTARVHFRDVAFAVLVFVWIVWLRREFW